MEWVIPHKRAWQSRFKFLKFREIFKIQIRYFWFSATTCTIANSICHVSEDKYFYINSKIVKNSWWTFFWGDPPIQYLMHGVICWANIMRWNHFIIGPINLQPCSFYQPQWINPKLNGNGSWFKYPKRLCCQLMCDNWIESNFIPYSHNDVQIIFLKNWSTFNYRFWLK